MRRGEVASAINDFRNAFRDDLGAPIVYGKRVVSSSGGFSIDKRNEDIEWVTETSNGTPLYGSVSLANKEKLIDAGLSTSCTGIITCIYEDILDIQPVEEGTNEKRIDKRRILGDRVKAVMNGVEETFNIVDFTFAFQLTDTYIFMKLGVVRNQ